jgi:hypothetical protein
MADHLIIPDGHAHPEYSNTRFDLVGKLIADVKPDVVIEMGDLGDMASLSPYDKGKKGYERNSYHRDVEVTVDAHERILFPMRKLKRKMPRLVKLWGNHEQRVNKAIELDHVLLEEVISPKDFQFEDNRWEVVPYTGSTPGIIIVDGIAYSHYFTSGVMGRPISGVHPAYQLLHKQYQSCVQGHTHTMDMCVRTKADGTYIMGIVAGVFVDYWMGYAGEANNLWWKGVIHLKNIENGFGDPEFISMKALYDAYGDTLT